MAGIFNDVVNAERAEYTRSSSGQFMQFTDGTDTFGFYNHAGTPEGNVTANIGALAMDTSNGKIFFKKTDSANTGWSVPVQAVQSVLNTTGSTTANIPRDTSVPQNTEGAEWDTLAITPTNASNLLRIRFYANVEHAGSGAATHMCCLFQDSTAGALQTNFVIMTDAGDPNSGPLMLDYSMVAGTTSSTTFKIRYGNNGGGSYTTYMNRGNGSSTAFFGASGNTVFTIEELAV